MYVSIAEGTYVNWFAITKSTYDKTQFGRFANDKPFQSIGLATFLLQVVQMQAVVQGYSPDIYLQANKSAEAAQYYQHRRFVMMQENSPKLLPESLYYLYSQSSDDLSSSSYLYFVTNEQLMEDAIRNNEDPNSPEVKNSIYIFMS